MPSITMHDLAVAAGVSRSTVSRALRNDPRISLKVRQNIAQLATKMGYRRNPLVTALMAGLRQGRAPDSSPIMAFLTSHPTEEGWRNTHAALQYYHGAKRRCEQLGYRLEPFWLGAGNWHGERMAQILHTRGITGILVAPTPSPDLFAALKFSWEHFAIVGLGRSSALLSIHRVAIDEFHLIFSAFSRLLSKGYQRIGVAVYEIEVRKFGPRFLGSIALLEKQISPKMRIPLYRPALLEKEGFLQWCDRYQPDAVLTLEPKAKEWLTQAGQALKLIIFSPAGKILRMAGASAVDLVATQLNHNEFGLPEHPLVISIEEKIDYDDEFPPSAGGQDLEA